MKRIYFDTDVINNLRDGNYPELMEVIDKFRDCLLIPLSPAHVQDKMVSLATRPDLFWKEMDFLTELTQHQLLRWEQKEMYMSAEIATARQLAITLAESEELVKEYSNFDNIISYMRNSYEELNISDDKGLIDSLELMLNLKFTNEEGKSESVKERMQNSFNQSQEIKDNPMRYRELRHQMYDQFRLPLDASNWTVDVIERISQIINAETEHKDFVSYVASMLDEKQKKDRCLFYTQCFVHLGNIGYCPDKIQKNKGMTNHLYDAFHSFYAGYCDYFVVKDWRMEKKTRALFEAFNISTKVIRYNELADELSVKLANPSTLVNVSKLIESGGSEKLRREGDLLVGVYELDANFLNYFTHVQVELGDPSGMTGLSYSKRLSNYSSFLFYHEFDSIVNRVGEFLGVRDVDILLEKFRKGVKEEGQYFKDFEYPDHTYIRLYANSEEFMFFIIIYTAEMRVLDK